jgi:hypothetical protein
MKRTSLVILLVCACCLNAAVAQGGQKAPARPTPAPPTKAEPPAISSEQQQQIAAKRIAVERIQVEVAAGGQRIEELTNVPFDVRLEATLKYMEAKARLDTAQAELRASVYYVMACLKVSPLEWELQPTRDGSLRFTPIQPAK